MRTLFAMKKDDKIYLSFFKDIMNKPRVEFDSQEKFDAEILRRGCKVEWLTKD